VAVNFWFYNFSYLFMVINSVLVGKGRGSAGNVTAGVWKGIPYIRQKPTTVANPRTKKQTINRDYMKIIGFWSTALKPFNDAVWATKAIKQSATNAWASAQRKTGTFELTQDGYPTSISLGGLVIHNTDTPPSSMSATESGANLVLSVAGLPSSRSYSVVTVGQSTEFEFDVIPVSGNSSNGSGVLTQSVALSAFALSNVSWAYMVIVDDVSGQMYSYSSQVA
jgi:hypothetical protein